MMACWRRASTGGRAAGLQRGPALQRLGQLGIDGGIARLQRDGALQIALIERAAGQLGAQRRLLGLQRLDAAGQGVQLALLLVRQLLCL